MAETFNSEINVGPPPVTLRKRRSFGAIGIIALLLILGAGGGLVWLNSDKLEDLLHTGTANGDRTPVLASAGEGGVSAADFTAFQQQTGGSIQAATDVVAAQQIELKRLSSQIEGLTTQVVGLTSKIDQLQGQGRTGVAQQAAGLAASAPAVAPAVAPAAAVTVASRPASTSTAPRKRAVDRPSGAISVGGAPLPATSAPAPR